MSKPKVSFVGKNGNTMNLLAICTKALKEVGQTKEADELTVKVFDAGSYDQALSRMREYCDIK